jgi:hypothetical protein
MPLPSAPSAVPSALPSAVPSALPSAVTGMPQQSLAGLRAAAGAQETLCGQAYGAKLYRSVGVVLQRAVLVNLLVGALICGLWSQADRVLLTLGQDPAIAAGEEGVGVCRAGQGRAGQQGCCGAGGVARQG